MKKAYLIFSLVLTLIIAPTVGAKTVSTPPALSSDALYPTGFTGYDISYPNCTISPISNAPFGIVGLNNGLNFSQNPCAATQASWFNNLSFYMNTGYPGATSANAQKYMTYPLACDSSDLNCIAYDYGYNAALYSLSYAQTIRTDVTMWWLDVETANSWTTDYEQNKSTLQGFYDAIKANSTAQVGIYSTTAQWGEITGGWLNGWPSWGATVVRSANKAAQFCTGHEFTGGTMYLIQYRGSIDLDYAC